jgi:DNA-binding SARP family transcriptional activator
MGQAASSGWSLNLLGFWQLRLNGQPIDVSPRQQRVIAVLALLGSRSRHSVASLLWPDNSEAQASGSLRAGVFRISHQMPSLLRDSVDPLALDLGVSVDIQQLRHVMEELDIDGNLDVPTSSAELLRTADLLPGWYEDWVIFEQERFKQQRLGALETLTRNYLTLGQLSHAIDAASAAVAIEPLRETAQLLLVRSYLAANDRASATRVARAFHIQLERELGIAPSPSFAALLNIESRGEADAHALISDGGSARFSAKRAE